MFKNLLVPTTGGPGDAAVFATARLAAVAFAAHLEFLHVRIDTTEVLMSMTSGGVGGGDAVQAVIDRMDAEADALAATARRAVDDMLAAAGIPLCDAPQGTGASAEYSMQQGDRSAWVAQYGRFADLVVMGRGGPDDGAGETLEAVLMDTGKPLLIAPAAAPASLGKRIVIAWKDTPEAARAVSCALAFISRAEQVTIVSVAGVEASHRGAAVADVRSVARKLYKPSNARRPAGAAPGTDPDHRDSGGSSGPAPSSV